MKSIYIFLILILLGYSGCRTSKPAAESKPPLVQQGAPGQSAPKVNFSDQSTWILGYFDLNKLFQPPYSSWFLSGYDDYQYNYEAVNKLRDLEKSDISIKVVLGTWCPDSRREVPRFMRILNLIDFAKDKVNLIGVDNVKNSPVENYSALNILRVPTFIFFKNNIEIGRIIENPATSLEQDMINILTGMNKN